ncbi:MAG: methylenetetrahydrofolate reductase [NAD(P)H] [Anaeromicrobium sp.]|jgi:methylenetetrahydrofolate reductase (NADPH)|uniref:methylenetetrahydrofolate reductase [NAD(P)H] n=1 Tax=Anaeromicrobium sp. TaxID=1929132 RepID=UPI0025EDD694|nr:methylenetetrahydrofolate reductase [NAD(P)H] [Anaeromicrobium sp.]MCT4593665.1 methylenetetrahydrofolate reductase [NAD(P)H] [Anaeromicrobium sp.]
MKIKNLFNQKKPVISFEIFPPKKSSSIDTIYKTIDGLGELKPDYISVTYGAGGSGHENKTLEIASIVKNKYNIEALAHLTCISSTKDEIDHVLRELRENNIENILALRGDIPNDPDFKFPDPLHYRYGSDLVKHIRDYGKFSIGGACYPEGHIENNNMDKDMENLIRKVNCGTDFLITQLFFENNNFYKFHEDLLNKGINIPIQAGIMPVTNKKQVERIVSLCGSYIPPKFMKIMNKYEHNKEALMEAGICYATEQIIDLLSSGIDGIHIYTMNKPEIAHRIIKNIGYVLKALNEKAV